MKNIQLALLATAVAVMASCKGTQNAESISDASEAQFMGNTSCPISGFDADPEFYAEHEGQRVYFCCSKCTGKGQAEPAAFVAKAYAEPAAVGNEDCPITGRGVSDESGTWQGHTVGLCCGRCEKKFAKDPGKYTAVALTSVDGE